MSSMDTNQPITKCNRVRLYAFIKKRRDLTLDEFYLHWRKIHSPLFRSLPIVQKNILRYEQSYTNQEISNNFISASIDMELSQSNMELDQSQWDGIALLEAESWDKMMQVFRDPEYLRTAVPDEYRFIDTEALQVLPAEFATVLST